MVAVVLWQAAALLDVDDKTRLGLLLAQRSGKYEEADVVFDCAAFPTEEERVKALAEAFAEYMHEAVRKIHWGYDPNEMLTNEALIREKYQGIRPAPGYPACPEHTEKKTLFELLEAEKNTGIRLTESFAMYPAASVSGWYFSHPNSKYFGLGNIEKDQVESYATRKEMHREMAEKWLMPVLNYDI